MNRHVYLMSFVLCYSVQPVFVFTLRNTPAQVHLIVHAFLITGYDFGYHCMALQHHTLVITPLGSQFSMHPIALPVSRILLCIFTPTLDHFLCLNRVILYINQFNNGFLRITSSQ